MTDSHVSQACWDRRHQQISRSSTAHRGTEGQSQRRSGWAPHMAARPPPLPSRKDRRTDCPAAQPGPEQGAAALGRRTEIERLYARHNPAKLGPELENLIAKYGERRLLAMARKKYGVVTTGAGDDMCTRSERRLEIERLYAQHNPEKLAQVGELAAKYGEKKLLAMVRKKYAGRGMGGSGRIVVQFTAAGPLGIRWVQDHSHVRILDVKEGSQAASTPDVREGLSLAAVEGAEVVGYPLRYCTELIRAAGRPLKLTLLAAAAAEPAQAPSAAVEPPPKPPKASPGTGPAPSSVAAPAPAAATAAAAAPRSRRRSAAKVGRKLLGGFGRSHKSQPVAPPPSQPGGADGGTFSPTPAVAAVLIEEEAGGFDVREACYPTAGPLGISWTQRARDGAAVRPAHFCACIGSPCLRQCVHGAPIGCAWVAPIAGTRPTDCARDRFRLGCDPRSGPVLAETLRPKPPRQVVHLVKPGSYTAVHHSWVGFGLVLRSVNGRAPRAASREQQFQAALQMIRGGARPLRIELELPSADQPASGATRSGTAAAVAEGEPELGAEPPSPPPPSAAAALARRAEIERLYARHNPAKLGPELEDLIAKYGERRLLAMARKKYGVQGGSHAAAAAPAAPPPSTAVASAPPEAEAEAVAPVEAETPSTAAAAAAASSVLRAQLAEEAELAAELSACRGR
jgi:hypothetical protein